VRISITGVGFDCQVELLDGLIQAQLAQIADADLVILFRIALNGTPVIFPAIFL